MKIYSCLLMILTCLVTRADAGWKYLSLNDLPNDAVLEDNSDPDDGLIQIRSRDGSFETIVFEQPRETLFVDFGAGDDRFEIDGKGLTGFAATIILVGGDGDDEIAIEQFVTASSVFIDDMSGARTTVSIKRSQIGADLHINDGPGSMSLTVGRTAVPLFADTIKGSIYVTSPDGGSSIRIGDPNNRDLGFVALGGGVFVENQLYGGDSFRLYGSIDGDVYLNNGNGNAGFTSFRSAIRGRFTQLVDSGEMSTNVVESSFADSVYCGCREGATRKRLTLFLAQKDVVFQNGLGFDDVFIAATWADSIDIRNGNGGSRTDLIGAGPPGDFDLDWVNITNGNGSDEVFVRTSSYDFIEAINIDNGHGNSTVEVESRTSAVTLGSLNVKSGNGNDRCVVTNVECDGDITVNHGHGGSDVAIVGSSLNALSIRSNRGSDYLRISDSIINGATTLLTGRANDIITVTASVFLDRFEVRAGSGYDVLESSSDNTFGQKVIRSIEQFTDLPGS